MSIKEKSRKVWKGEGGKKWGQGQYIRRWTSEEDDQKKVKNTNKVTTMGDAIDGLLQGEYNRIVRQEKTHHSRAKERITTTNGLRLIVRCVSQSFEATKAFNFFIMFYGGSVRPSSAAAQVQNGQWPDIFRANYFVWPDLTIKPGTSAKNHL